ncbi:hypothetical protein GJ496_006872 [Pomphorhynchus laevis]|nr:hypothetical protein GJ496_006872 [Pomphorhynchus laevis]
MIRRINKCELLRILLIRQNVKRKVLHRGSANLVSVQLICRHTDRSYVRYPPAWNYKHGQLTDAGVYQSINLGQYLRGKYFTGESVYNFTTLKLFSTSSAYSGQTAIIIGSNLFANPNGQNNYTPVPSNIYEYGSKEFMMENCPTYKSYYYTKLISKRIAIDDQVDHHTNMYNGNMSFIDIFRSYQDELAKRSADDASNRENTLLESEFQLLENRYINITRQLISKKHLGIFIMAPVFQTLFKHFDIKIKNSSEADRFNLYVVDDEIIHGCYYWLHENGETVAFKNGSYIAFELYRKSNEQANDSDTYHVKILLYEGTRSIDNHISDNVKDITSEICDGNDECSIAKLNAIIGTILKFNYKTECNYGVFAFEITDFGELPGMIMFTIGVGIICGLIIHKYGFIQRDKAQPN